MTDIQETWLEKMATKYSTEEKLRQAYSEGAADVSRAICSKLEAIQHEVGADAWREWRVISDLLEFIELKTGVDTERYVVIDGR